MMIKCTMNIDLWSFIVDQIITHWLSEMMQLLRYQFRKAFECTTEGMGTCSQLLKQSEELQ